MINSNLGGARRRYNLKNNGLLIEDLAEGLAKIQVSRRLQLPTGTLRDPIVLTGLRGTAERPVIIEGVITEERQGLACLSAPLLGDEIRHEPDKDADRALFLTRISSCATEDDFKQTALELARRREAGGHYPTIAEAADQAMLKLIDCQHVVIRDLHFDGCWPTAIYLDECEFITMDCLRFDGGTYSIAANGTNTHDLLIQNCRHSQNEEIWKNVEWKQIHGATNTRYEPTEGDSRHLDGDFFRAWNIFGNVTIRNNWIGDCFNAIHFFARSNARHNSSMFHPPTDTDSAFEPGGITSSMKTLASCNILIENNVFYHVRDNCIEPEDFGWNWVVRYNRFDACYIPFSLGVQQAGWFYIYGNTGVLTASPGNEDHENRATRLMKLPKKQNFGGPIYMFHNSWILRKKHFGKFILRHLRHENNAIQFKGSQLDGLPGNLKAGGLFGVERTGFGVPPKSTDREERRNFTRRWGDLDIQCQGDVSNDLLTVENPMDLSDIKKLFKETSGRPLKFLRALFYGYWASINYAALGYVINNHSDAKGRSKTAYVPQVFNPPTKKRPHWFALSRQAGKVQDPAKLMLSLPRRFAMSEDRKLIVSGGSCSGAVMANGELYKPSFWVMSEAEMQGKKGKPMEDFTFLPDISMQEKALVRKFSNATI